MTSVSTKVTATTAAWTEPVLATEWRSWGLTVRYPITMRSPARAGRAILETTEPNSRITAAITTAAYTSASRLRAPAEVISDDPDIDPPTGMPWRNPHAAFAAPCPRKSRDASE